MKNGIKIFIALFFIVSAFSVGKYFCLDDSKSKINKINEEVNRLNEQNKILQDSLNLCKETIKDTSNKLENAKEKEVLNKKK